MASNKNILPTSQLEESELFQIAKHLDTQHWYKIGNELGLSPTAVDYIAERYKDQPYAEKAHRLLLEWRERKPEKCNAAELIKALESAGLNNTSMNVNKLLLASDTEQITIGEGSIQFNPDILLAKGCHGTAVYRGRFSRRDAAIKEIDNLFAGNMDNEIRVLKHIGLDISIVKYLGFEEFDGFKYVAFELCQGNLVEYVETENGNLQEMLGPKDLLRHITEGLHFLHEKQIVHCDIKPVHILISTSDVALRGTRAVISGFGHSKINLKPRTIRHSYVVGDSGFTSYEILQQHKSDTAADVFSLGCVYYYVLTMGKTLFHSDYDVLHRQPDIDSPISHRDSITARTLIREMISQTPLERPSCLEILKSDLLIDSRHRGKSDAVSNSSNVERLLIVQTDGSSPILQERDMLHENREHEEMLQEKRDQEERDHEARDHEAMLHEMQHLLGRSLSFFKHSPAASDASSETVYHETDSGHKIKNPKQTSSPQTLVIISSRILYYPNNALGFGATGTIVFKGLFHGKRAAVKRMNRHFCNLVEMEVMISSCHDNVLKYYGIEESGRFYYLAMEECQGNLTEYIKCGEKFSGETLNSMELLKQITRGLKYLHDRKIVHSNLEPNNILISFPNKKMGIQGKVSNFGTMRKDYGKAGFTSFECLQTKTGTNAGDIFSLGCVFCYIVSKGRQLFYSHHDVLHREPIFTNLMPIYKRATDQRIPFDEICMLIRLMIDRNLDVRPSCDEVLRNRMFSME